MRTAGSFVGLAGALVCAAYVGIACGSAAANSDARTVYPDVPLEVHTPRGEASFALRRDGRRVSFYHLELTNWSSTDILLRSVRIRNAESGEVLRSLDSAVLGVPTRLRHGLARSEKDAGRAGLRIAAGETVALGLELFLPAGQAPPANLTHDIDVQFAAPARVRAFGDTAITHATITTTPMVIADGSLVFDAPLHGGYRVDHALDERGEHRYLVVAGGALHDPTSFAIDLVPQTCDPGPARRCAEVLAVVGGRVVAVHDGEPDAGERVTGPRASSANAAAGNWIALDAGGGRSVFYAHLKRGSIRVAAGDRVASGAVIAEIGASGAARERHLHLQAAVGRSPIESDGVAFALRQLGGITPASGERVMFP